MNYPDASGVVYTLTLAPCIDKSTRVDRFMPEKKLLCDHPVWEPGGGGINVSKVLARLGVPSFAIYISGGYSGKMLDEMMRHEKFPSKAIPSLLQTRENFIVYEKSSHLQFRFGMPVNPICKEEQQEIISCLENGRDFRWLVISGSAHKSVPISFYKKIFSIARKKGAYIFCDTDRYTLQKLISLGPDWIKPNRAEWEHLLGEKINLDRMLLKTGKRYAEKFSVEIVISDGAKGAWFFNRDGRAIFFPSPPGIKVRSTVGAGDSMVAGIIYALSQQMQISDAVKFGMACAISTVTNKESEFTKKHEALRWNKKITGVNL